MMGSIVTSFRIESALVDPVKISNGKTANATTITTELFKCLFPLCFVTTEDSSDTDYDECSSNGESDTSSSFSDDHDEYLYGESVRLEASDMDELPVEDALQFEEEHVGSFIHSPVVTPGVSNTSTRPSSMHIMSNYVTSFTHNAVYYGHDDVHPSSNQIPIVRDDPYSCSMVNGQYPLLSRAARFNTVSKAVVMPIAKDKVAAHDTSRLSFPAHVEGSVALQRGGDMVSLLQPNETNEPSLLDDDVELLDRFAADRTQYGMPQSESDLSSNTASLVSFPSLSFSSDVDGEKGTRVKEQRRQAIATTDRKREYQDNSKRFPKRVHRHRRETPDWASPNACFYNSHPPQEVVVARVPTTRSRRRRHRLPSLTSPNACFYNHQEQRPSKKDIVKRGGGVIALCRALEG